MANDFTPASASSPQGFAWYAIGPFSGSPATVSGGFTWRIFADAAGSLGGRLYGGTVAGAAGAMTPYGC